MSGDAPVPAVPNVELHDGVAIPQLGFGVFQVPPEETQAAVEEALAVGYRHIDTAAAYRNEAAVGAAIAASDIPREELFVTTKLWNGEQGHQSTLDACARSLELLGLDHVDLYLIHWPLPMFDLYLDTWRAFEEIKIEGRSRSIGVSNFRVEELERLGREADQQPTINQIELHPYLQQAELRSWHAEHAEKRPRHLQRRQALGAAVRVEIRVPGLRRCDVGEAARLASQVEIVRRRYGGRHGVTVKDHHEAIGIVIWQGSDEDGPEHREERRDGADAERQRQGRREGVPGRPRQAANGVTEVGGKMVHVWLGRPRRSAR